MDEIEDLQYKKMTETPVGKLIIMLGIPTTLSMLITNIYNMADTYFVSQISISASGATGIVFALMAILQAFGFMFGHGAGSHISRQLGAKKIEKAKIYSSTSFFMALFLGAFILIFGLLFLEPLMKLLGSTDTILNDAKTYAIFILLAGPAMTTGCVLNNILRYEGKAFYAMIGLTCGGVLNMIMDPILIFGLGMDIAGAGLSTTLSQYISCILLMIPFMRGKTVTKIHYRYFTKEFYDIRNIIVTGLPSLMRQGMNSLSTSFLNVQASVYGDSAIAAMSIVSRCGNLLFSCALGIAQGFQPVCAYNYGAKKYERVKKGTWFTMIAGISILSLFCSVCFIYANDVICLFRSEASIVEIGGLSLKYLCLALLSLPISSVGSMLFQSIGKSGTALLLACIQSGFIFIPLISILPHFFHIYGIMLAQPCSYVIAAMITLPFVIKFLKTMKE
jgi:putative efflux protein, MATE family